MINDEGIDYEQVLTVIINGPQPARALEAFVDQEREAAMYVEGQRLAKIAQDRADEIRREVQ